LIAKELISNTLPFLIPSDTGQKATTMMESFRVAHLPLIKGNEYLGLVSDQNIYDLELENKAIGENPAVFINPFVQSNQHIYEVVRKLNEFEVSVLPVLDLNKQYLGAIMVSELSEKFVKLVAVNEPGAVIVLELNPNDYSLSQIAQIVESNDAKVLSLYTHATQYKMELDVTLKVNITDVSSIVQTFVRYDYNIKAVYMDDSLLNNLYAERFELFMKYMDL
jgi:acetoin utilization protein AcuB